MFVSCVCVCVCERVFVSCVCVCQFMVFVVVATRFSVETIALESTATSRNGTLIWCNRIRIPITFDFCPMFYVDMSKSILAMCDLRPNKHQTDNDYSSMRR